MKTYMVSRLVQRGRRLFPLHSHKQISKSSGFLLPVVIALSIAISTVSFLALQTVANNSTQLNTQYYSQIAREAAQAGISAAAKCISVSKNTTWSDDNSNLTNLTPATDCSGDTSLTSPARVASLVDNDSYTSTYTVGTLDKKPNATNPTSVTVTSIGKVSVKIPGGGISKTITKSVRTLARTTVTNQPRNVKDIAQISTGTNSTCAVTKAPDSWVYCWGDNTNGELGIGQYSYKNIQSTPKPVAGAATSIIPGSATYCTSGIIILGGCIGGTFVKDLLDSPAQAASGLMNTNGTKKAVTKVSVGSTHSCAIADGTAYCWGDNTYGQLGNRSTTDSMIPVAVDVQPNDVALVPGVPSVCLAYVFICVSYSTAIPDVPAKPKSVLAGKTITDISVGLNSTCALTSEGKIVCWGENSSGQLGTNDTTDANYPANYVYTHEYIPKQPDTPATPGTCVAYIFVCISYNPAPTPFIAGDPAVPETGLYNKSAKYLARAVGATTMCATTTADKAVCWGNNAYGQVGDKPNSVNGTRSASTDCSGGSTVYPHITITSPGFANVLNPTTVANPHSFDQITVFPTLVTAKATGSPDPNRMYYWSSWNVNVISTSQTRVTCGSTGGQSGSGVNKWIGTTKVTYSGASTVPTDPLYNGTTDALDGKQLSLSSGNAVGDTFCAQYVLQLYCDANNTGTSLGQTGSLSPQAAVSSTVYMDGVLSGQSVTAISSGDDYTCVIASDKPYCWGLNDRGQLGDATTSNRNVAVSVDPSGDIGQAANNNAADLFGNPISF